MKINLKSDIIIIPEYPNEETGHADGLIRFIDENTVFINDTKYENEKKWLGKLLTILKENKLNYIELPCYINSKQGTADGLYINYLHLGNLIIVPQFGKKIVVIMLL